MNLIVALDDNNGILFNHRRQSRDEALRRDILALTRGSKLYMSAYSARQFDPAGVTVSEDFLCLAGPGDYCFAESAVDTALAERLIVYRWHRVYPADTYVSIDPKIWHLTSSRDFAGKSHECITVEVYER